MSDAAGDHTGHHDQADQERALREFLEREVPRLPASEDRMRGVRERIRRRRRRRAAAAAGTTALVGIAAAGLLLPGDPPAEPSFVPPAAAPTGTVFHHAELDGLALRLPPGWHGTATRKDRMWGKAGPVAYLTSQDLPQPFATCPADVNGPCPPNRPTDGGSVLAAVSLDRSVALHKKIRTPAGFDTRMLGPYCRSLGAKRELYGLFAVGGATNSHPATAVVTLCTYGPATATAPLETALRQALATARITPSGTNS
ncbi:hypothetical protein ACIBL6_22510 [Streptomyces sp. NPDC050400]|uniref:hypothetical protein n=1 Tax=Streptomyces sp. NPDC050400 TaxID=3365610 RepID=UPI00378B1846